jgi:hypothetical protein
MFKIQNNASSAISILLLTILLFALVFYSASSQSTSTIILTISIGTAIIYTIHRNWEIEKIIEIKELLSDCQ